MDFQQNDARTNDTRFHTREFRILFKMYELTCKQPDRAYEIGTNVNVAIVLITISTAKQTISFSITFISTAIS